DVVYGLGHFDLTDRLRLSSEMSFSKVVGVEPANQSNGYNWGLGGNSIPIDIDNPFLSAQARDIFAAQGRSNFYLSRAVLDVTPGNNAVHSEGTTERVVVALDGDFTLGERDYYWNVAGNYGHS